MLLYDVFYYYPDGRRQAGCDFNVPVNNFKAPKGEWCQATCTNGERHSFWVNDKGECFDRPPWDGPQKKYDS